MGHIPVLFNECLEGLSIREDKTYLDMTLGGFGHGRAICERLSEKGTYIGIDLDLEAIERGKRNSSDLSCSIHFVHAHFNDFEKHLDMLGISKIDGCLIDLGVCSYQIDNPERGFSFQKDGALDMRMDQSRGITAGDVVNTYSENVLRDIFKIYGEEKFSQKIAQAIVKRREEKPFETTLDLAECIKNAIPKKFRYEGKHPATRCFQAIRIEVNGELSGLSETIQKVIDRLSTGGRVCIISFHSLEDKIVKKVFQKNSQGCTCPPDFPVCICGNRPKIKRINSSPITPGKEELDSNIRSRSAKLRIAEKLDFES